MTVVVAAITVVAPPRCTWEGVSGAGAFFCGLLRFLLRLTFLILAVVGEIAVDGIGYGPRTNVVFEKRKFLSGLWDVCEIIERRCLQ